MSSNDDLPTHPADAGTVQPSQAASQAPSKAPPPEEPPFVEAGFIRLRSVLAPVDTGRFFPRSQPVELELGAGDGSFLVRYASAHPDVNFVGVERLLGRIRKIARKSARAGLTNVLCLRVEIGYLLEHLLPANTLSAIHVYFPDPWPKRKHTHKRLVNEKFTQLAHRLLVPRGRVHLRTDDEDYHRQMVEVFGLAQDKFEPCVAAADLIEVTTDFERDFLAKGIPTRRADYRSK